MLSLLLAAAIAQQHGTEPQQAMRDIAWMQGDWTGKQSFNTGGDPMVGDATVFVEEAIGGRYLEERLSTTLPGRKPTDTRHYITFDPASQTYKAWWFNDTSVGPTELEGKIVDGKLVLLSKPKGQGPQNARLRATYEIRSQRVILSTFERTAPSASNRVEVARLNQPQAFTSTLTFTLEMDPGGDAWQLLFTSTYTKKK